MIFKFGNFQVDIDIEKTKEFYDIAPFVSDNCECDGCRNYEKASEYFPHQVISFFDSISIDVKKPAEIYVNCSENGGELLFYGGFYHLCGSILEGESAWVTIAENHACWDNKHTFQLADGYYISFQSDCSLVDKNFPTPVIQLEIEFHVPWTLGTVNTYE